MSDEDLEFEQVARVARPPKRQREAATARQRCKQDSGLVTRVCALAREGVPLRQIDVTLHAEGERAAMTSARASPTAVLARRL